HYAVLRINDDQFGISRDVSNKVCWAEGLLTRRYFYPGCHLMEPYRTMLQDRPPHLPVTEAVSLAKAKGIKLAYKDPLAQVEEVCRLTATNVSSMLQDVLAKRRTEIDAINGAVEKIGNEVVIPTPINSLLTSLVRTIELSYDLQVQR
ncbi:MAG: hypothetical protein HY801_04485, partial [Candidatus Lindowbacteria bacterium]|nr:hypothetical protein [Candidatus Lindowbacteria bacterium]